ncbi:unnamed protein product [Anisakis simplex]|uniref:Secreted protein n=1 Tax=Anisakis simplex TaxID=6269 RepID=A0A0M3JGG7_ANISI|nr:unnamed protein product [Anisakis simplex]
MNTFAKMVVGLGTAASSIHKDLYKIVRNLFNDRVMSVRVAAINVSGFSSTIFWYFR